MDINMDKYKYIIAELNLPDTIAKCVSGEIRMPSAIFAHPLYWYGFPPALVPIWSKDSLPSYWGYWKHWFCDRQGSFIHTYIEDDRRVTEIARTAEQFFLYSEIYLIVAYDNITTEIITFAEQVGISYLDQLDSLTSDTGDDPKGFLALPQFAQDPPLNCVQDVSLYPGDFPSGDFAAPSWIDRCCSFELPKELIEQWPEGMAMPPWLKPKEPKPALFKKYLSAGDLASAWLTLNSTGWWVSEARKALKKLKKAARDRLFSRMADAWLDVSSGHEDLYY